MRSSITRLAFECELIMSDSFCASAGGRWWQADQEAAEHSSQVTALQEGLRRRVAELEVRERERE